LKTGKAGLAFGKAYFKRRSYRKCRDGYTRFLGDSIAIWVDPRTVDNHFGTTPIYGMVLPEEEGEQLSES
jgi:hypothetical protein